MTNKIVKKAGFQITEIFNFGTTTMIETDENLKQAEKFINNTGIVNSILILKNRIFGEKIQNNAINVLSGTEKKVLGSGFNGERQELETKVAVNLIENASLEDGERLQDIWSNMLANAITGKVDVKNSYIDILRQLTETEVIFLDFLFNQTEFSKKTKGDYDIKNNGFTKKSILQILKINENNFEIIVDNLVRLNLIHTGNGSNEDAKDDTYISLHMKRGLILLTCLGYEFIKACKFN